MWRRSLALMLVCLLVHLSAAAPTFAQAQAEQEAQHTARVKAGILKLGTGEQARVKLRLRDKTKLAGYVSAADAESFIVVNPKTGVTTTVAYAQVKQIKGHNLSTGAKIAIGFGVLVGALLVTYLILNAKCHGNIIFCE
ncbi:MAG: hypothetical protein ACJ74W_03025 [Pyrinomonadaceae bacterium]